MVGISVFHLPGAAAMIAPADAVDWTALDAGLESEALSGEAADFDQQAVAARREGGPTAAFQNSARRFTPTVPKISTVALGASCISFDATANFCVILASVVWGATLYYALFLSCQAAVREWNQVTAAVKRMALKETFQVLHPPDPPPPPAVPFGQSSPPAGFVPRVIVGDAAQEAPSLKTACRLLSRGSYVGAETTLEHLTSADHPDLSWQARLFLHYCYELTGRSNQLLGVWAARGNRMRDSNALAFWLYHALHGQAETTSPVPFNAIQKLRCDPTWTRLFELLDDPHDGGVA